MAANAMWGGHIFLFITYVGEICMGFENATFKIFVNGEMA